MPLSLVELKEKLKPQLESLLNVSDFKIVSAEHKNNVWIIMVEYQKPYKGPAGGITYFRNEVTGMVVNDETGEIQTML